MIKLDFPEFGFPIMATLRPSFTISAFFSVFKNSLISAFIFEEIFLISVRRFLGISSSEKSIDASIRARQVFISSDHEKYLSLKNFHNA